MGKSRSKPMASQRAVSSDGKTPEPLQPVYTTPEANSAIVLYSGPMIFHRNEDRVQGDGKVLLDWLPSPRLRFEMRSNAASIHDAKLAFALMFDSSNKKDWSVELCNVRQTFEALTVGAGHIADSGLQVSGTIVGEIATGAKGQVSAVFFHLANVPEFVLSPDGFVHRKGNAARSWDRTVMRCDPWIVTLDPVENDGDLVKSARAIRGYAITRVGRIERADGKTFSFKAVQDFLEILKYLLSFALERWCPPMLLVGLDRQGRRKCELLTPCRVGNFQTRQGWFDCHHTIALSGLLPALHEQWKDGQIRQAFKDAIYWFIEIHQQPVHIETAIVLGQVTLEMLGWLILVEQKPIISDGGFGNLPAADRLKLLLSSCSIPIAVPSELASLHKLAKAENWQGPDALVALRNSIVHRSKKKRELAAKKKLGGDVQFECFRLICWYIELVLLRQLGYSGKYSNRLKHRQAGQVEPVPWAIVAETKPNEIQK